MPRTDHEGRVPAVRPGPRALRPKAPNSVIASAARITSKAKSWPRGNGAQPWQTEAVGFTRTTGELAYYQRWMGNAYSQVKLKVKERTVNDKGETILVDPENARPQQILDALFYGESGQSQMMRAFGQHLSVPGETWLAGIIPSPEEGASMASSDDDDWRVLSIDELRNDGGSRWVIDYGDGQPETYEDGTGPDKPAEIFLIRIWDPDPMRRVYATSPCQAAIPILRELQGIDMHIASSIDSRLKSAGILAYPIEASFSTPQSTAGDPVDGSTMDPFLSELAMTFAAAKQDQGSAAAQVPILLKMPGQWIKDVRLITLDSPFDAKTLELRLDDRTRLALTLDVPPEVLLGTADLNHWSAWLVDEDAIKLHLEPGVDLITDALMTQYLWPALLPAGTDPNARIPETVRKYVIIGDTSALRQRPNRSVEALEMWDRFAITNKAMLRERGFPEDDALTDTGEIQQRLMLMAALGKINPQLAASALASLGVELELTQAPRVGIKEDAGTVPADSVGGEAVAPPVTDARATPQGPPSPDQAAALQSSAEALVDRAVERANNRLNGRRRNRQPITDAPAITAALADAWGRVPRTAALCGVDAAALEAALDTYCRGLLASGGDPEPETLAPVLAGLLGRA